MSMHGMNGRKQKNSFISNNKVSANSLAEYILPVCFVLLIVTFVVKFAQSQDFSTFMARTVYSEAMTNNGIHINSFGSLKPPDDFKSLPALEEGQEYVCQVANNVCFVLSANAEASGGLGEDEIEKKLALLKQIREKLKAEGVDDAVIHEITNLANSGQFLADQLNIISGYCTPGSFCARENGGHAHTLLRALPPHIAEFNQMNQRLKDYIAAHPGMVPQWAEDLIASKAGEIKQLVEAVNAAQKEEVVVKKDRELLHHTFFDPGNPANRDPNHRYEVIKRSVDGYGRYKPGGQHVIVRVLDVYTAYNFNSYADRGAIVRSDSNDICKSGGQTSGNGSCLRGFVNFNPNTNRNEVVWEMAI